MSVEKKSNLREYLVYIIIIGSLVILGIYIIKNVDRFSTLFDISMRSLLLLVLLTLFTTVQNGYSNYKIYQNLGTSISYRECYGLAVINTLANQLPFAGGLIAKGVYLKKKYGLPYSRYLSATAALYVCFVATNGILGLISLGLIFSIQVRRIPIILITGFGLMIGSLAFLWLPLNLKFMPERWQKYLNNLAEGRHVLSRDPVLLLNMVLIQILSILTTAGRFWIAFQIFSQQITFLECGLFSSATILTRLVNIAPGGLGVREGIVAGLGILLGFEPGISAVAVGFDRLVATTIILILGSYFTYNLAKGSVQNVGE